MKEAFCQQCVRTLYLGDHDVLVCPVCSSPVLETASKVQTSGDPPTRSVDPGILPKNEGARLAAVRRYEVLDTPPDGAFDRIASLAARAFAVPIATISIVDSDRIWFKSHYGLDAEETSRDPGLCASAILQYEPWLVTDAKVDARIARQPARRQRPRSRFYLGVPLTTGDGYNLGTLNVIDVEPREVTEEQVAIVEDLAKIVVDELELRRTVAYYKQRGR
jgi:GAF domain-containing protein